VEETKINLWQHTVISVYFDMTAVPVFAHFSPLSPSYPPSVIMFHLFFSLRRVQQWLQPTACHVFLLQITLLDFRLTNFFYTQASVPNSLVGTANANGIQHLQVSVATGLWVGQMGFIYWHSQRFLSVPHKVNKTGNVHII
jgi:hypothetical protein